MKKHVIILVAFFILLYTGCSEKKDAIVDSDNNQQSTNQVPSEVQALLDNYSNPDSINLPDMISSLPDFRVSDINDSIYDVFLVAFLWGKLINLTPPVDVAYDWDGSLSVNGPSIVKSLFAVDFEHGEDSLIPEDITSSESWGSFTDNEFDGIVFLVLYDKVTPTFAPQVLTFSTTPITLQFDFSQLVHFFAYYPVDPAYGVAVAAHKIRLHHCREGYLNGIWHKSDTSDFVGSFEGLWFGAGGDTIGVYAGNFWQNEEGHNILEGWISGGMTNQVIAELHGFWYFDDYRMCPMCGAGHGQFKGRFQILNSDEHGYFQGEFGDYSLPPNDLIMPMHGRWHLDCVNVVNGDEAAN